MAVTFFVKDAPHSQVANEYFDSNEPEDPFYNPRLVEVSDWPELEVCQFNVRSLLTLANLPVNEEYAGSIQPEELHVLMRRLIQLLASTKQRKPMLREDEHLGIISMQGVDDDRIYSYITRLMNVVSYCIEHKRALHWS